MTNPSKQTAPTPIVRLSLEQYQELEKNLPTSQPSQDASPQHVGFLLGVQHALKVLRAGWVVGA